AAAIILIPGAPLLSIALNANVLATVLLPVALVFVILLVNDRQLMGDHVNGWLHNVAAGMIAVFVALCGTAYAVDSFLQAIHVI
ncbi:MAG: divalent metal cation transporter, partial [Solirubrobacterales bacterium]|nr:divalent metal cation transporter [Solirubrobacterales bacterium]